MVDKARARYPELEVRELNLAEHPEIGPRYALVSTPAIVVNGQLEFRGVPREHALLERLATIAKGDGD